MTDTRQHVSSAPRATQTAGMASHDQMARWDAAWGAGTALIAGDDELGLPELPDGYGWLVTRELTGEYPTYRVALLNVSHIDTGGDVELVRHGRIDKTLYGESGVRELAQRFANNLKIQEGQR